MPAIRPRSIDNIEKKMENAGGDPIRHKVLQSAKSFKVSWVDLGQALYAVWKDKLFKNWGYVEFDSYTAKEIGIKKQTALKLLRSYYFLEKEEPGYLKDNIENSERPSAIPTLEAIDTLRLASKKKTIDKSDYAGIRKRVLEDGADVRDVKKGLTQLIRQREELEPEEAREKKREALIRRYMATLKAIKEELRASKMLSAEIMGDIDKLLSKLDSEL